MLKVTQLFAPVVQNALTAFERQQEAANVQNITTLQSRT